MTYRAIICKTPPDYPYSERVFADTCAAFNGALKDLGLYADDGRPIAFGANVWTATVPDDCIIMQLEARTSPWFNDAYLHRLRTHPVLDYDLANVEWLQTQGVDAKWCPIRYHSSLTRLATNMRKDVDVLFYGGACERRLHILSRIENYMGPGSLRCKWIGHHEAWGQHEYWIPRSRIVLNCHYYEGAPLEMVRLAFLWANQAYVLTEGPVTRDFHDMCSVFKEGDAEDAANLTYLLATATTQEQRDVRTKYAFERFKTMTQADALKEALNG